MQLFYYYIQKRDLDHLSMEPGWTSQSGPQNLFLFFRTKKCGPLFLELLDLIKINYVFKALEVEMLVFYLCKKSCLEDVQARKLFRATKYLECNGRVIKSVYI